MIVGRRWNRSIIFHSVVFIWRLPVNVVCAPDVRSYDHRRTTTGLTKKLLAGSTQTLLE
jgi:hypothetical protein